MTALTVAIVNCLPAAEFIETFGDIAEHSPWVAERAAAARPFAGREAMIAAFETALRKAPLGKQLDLIRAHPDLASKAKLTADSASEQAGAGLDSLTEEEFARFTELNETYKTRFAFPFIFAVKGATKHQILEAFERRVEAPPEEEFETAISQICRIFRFRIEDRIAG